MPFWDERFAHATSRHPELQAEQVLIDALAAAVVLDPARFDVIVASNLFGDILSDLAAAVAGSIGIAPSGNLNPERDCPSMFEPVHGSAPDIAGRGVANPIGAIWSGAMMLDHLGETDRRGGRHGRHGGAARDRARARATSAGPRRPPRSRRPRVALGRSRDGRSAAELTASPVAEPPALRATDHYRWLAAGEVSL